MKRTTRSVAAGMILGLAWGATAQAGWIQNRRGRNIAEEEVRQMSHQEHEYLSEQELAGRLPQAGLEAMAVERFRETWKAFKERKRAEDLEFDGPYDLAAAILTEHVARVGQEGLVLWYERYDDKGVAEESIDELVSAYEASISPIWHTTPQTWAVGFDAFVEAEIERQEEASRNQPPSAPLFPELFALTNPAASNPEAPMCSEAPGTGLFGLGEAPSCNEAYGQRLAAAEEAPASAPVEEDAAPAPRFDEPDLPIEPISEDELELHMAAEQGTSWSAYREDAEGVVPGKAYVIQDGDTLGSLAIELKRAMLAEAQGYKQYTEGMTRLVEDTPIWGPRGLVSCIRWANQGLDSNALAVGQEIFLPTPLLLMVYRQDSAEASPAT